jgi:hypothetical protein
MPRTTFDTTGADEVRRNIWSNLCADGRDWDTCSQCGAEIDEADRYQHGDEGPARAYCAACCDGPSAEACDACWALWHDANRALAWLANLLHGFEPEDEEAAILRAAVLAAVPAAGA